MSETILITGASGLVGSGLRTKLKQEGHTFKTLTTNHKKADNQQNFYWSPSDGVIDLEAFSSVDTIVHLAGAGVADKPWSDKRKKEILDSRVQSTNLLFNTIKDKGLAVKTIVSASAIGYYGLNTGDSFVDEHAPKGDGFLAGVVEEWEQAVDQFNNFALKVVKLRIGVVLSSDGGALPKMVQPIKLGFGAPLGTGKQYLSWIHINDLVDMFYYAIKGDQLIGSYNAVSSEPVTNKQFTQFCAKLLKRPLWLPNVPDFALNSMLGEMAQIVLGGNKVSNKKIKMAGFKFEYENLEEALRNLLKK